MHRESVSRRAHDHGQLVADVYRAHVNGREFFSYQFSGPTAADSVTFWNLRSASKARAQELADQRVIEEFRLRNLEHRCSPDQCGGWMDVARPS
jgi:hypothetical protein